jgi:hypothetical protein
MRKTVYVNWERQTKSTERGRTQYQLVAFLVEGQPSENRKNAQVSIKLGAIQERFLHIRISRTRAFHQGLFWEKVDKIFRKLRLTKNIQETLEAQISEKVPRPAEDWAMWGVTCIPRRDC